MDEDCWPGAKKYIQIINRSTKRIVYGINMVTITQDQLSLFL